MPILLLKSHFCLDKKKLCFKDQKMSTYLVWKTQRLEKINFSSRLLKIWLFKKIWFFTTCTFRKKNESKVSRAYMHLYMFYLSGLCPGFDGVYSFREFCCTIIITSVKRHILKNLRMLTNPHQVTQLWRKELLQL